jgi:hypothetical protein
VARPAITHGSVIARPATTVPYALPLLHVPASGAGQAVRNAYDFLCTATAVSPYQLVTAAHCATPGGLYYVLVGGNTFGTGKPVPVTAVRYRADYNPDAITHDIAVMRTLLPMHLPSYPKIGTRAMATGLASYRKQTLRTYGWGRPTDTKSPDQHLRGVTVKTLRAAAQRFYGPGFHPSSELAAGNPLPGGVVGGTCHGDSGGPLVQTVKGTPWLVGVTSFGPADACDAAPGVFTSVGVYRSWISTALRALRAQPVARSRALPVLLARPTISGMPKPGATLTCTSRWTSNATRVAATWYRGTARVGSGARHVVVAADAGKALQCRVTATSHAGHVTARSAARTVLAAVRSRA